jgi:hypothetical protein
LLAGDRVDHSLEHGREARRFQAAQTPDELVQQWALRCRRRERREVDPETKQPSQRSAGRRLGLVADPWSGERDRQTWPPADLPVHRDRRRGSVQFERTAVGVRIPAVDRVVSAAAQRPCREIQSKWREIANSRVTTAGL